MIENKQFTLSKDKNDETIFNNDIAMGIIDVVEKLNDFYEENQLLKQALKELLKKEGDETYTTEKSPMIFSTLGELADKMNELHEEDKGLEDEIKSLKKQNNDYFNNINNLILDNMIFKNEIIALRKRDELIRSYLYDDRYITLEKYNKIVDYLYEELRNKVVGEE